MDEMGIIDLLTARLILASRHFYSLYHYRPNI
jgi:hypothetical protein